MRTGTPFSLERYIQLLVIAWKSLLSYPPGHPALRGTVSRAREELERLLAIADPVVIGVTRDSLVWKGEELRSLGAQQLAAALYPRDVAVVRFAGGVTDEELSALLLALRPARPDEAQISLQAALDGAALDSAGVAHVTLENVDYSHVVVTSELEKESANPGGESGPERGGAAGEGGQASSLFAQILAAQMAGRPPWAGERRDDEGTQREQPLQRVVGLLNEALARAGGAQGVRGAPPGERDQGAVAELRELMLRTRQAVEGFLEASPRQGGSREARLREVVRLIRALPPSLRSPVLDGAMHLLVRQRDEPALRSLAASLSAVEALRSLRRFRDQGGELTAEAVRLVEALALSADPSPGEGRRQDAELPPMDLRQALPESFELTPFSRPQPLVFRLPPQRPPSAAAMAAIEGELESLSPRAQMIAQVQTLLSLMRLPILPPERNEGLVARLLSAFHGLLASGRPDAACALILQMREQAAASSSDVARRAHLFLEQVAGVETIPALVEAVQSDTSGDVTQWRRLLELLGDELFRHLLSVLGEADDRRMRRALFEVLQALPARVAAEAPAFLTDPRWFVVRNTISLLHAVGARETAPRIMACLDHADPRVRAEALKALIDFQIPLPPEQVLRLLSDSNEGVAWRAIKLVGGLRLSQAVPHLLDLLRPVDRAGEKRSLRLEALRSLGEIGDPSALPELKRFFGAVLVSDDIEERRAAFLSLAGYPLAQRRTWLRKGQRSLDPEIRETCRRLLAASPAGGADG